MNELPIYKCGHAIKPIFVDNNPLSVTAYFMWRETAKDEMCFDCFCAKNL